VAGAVEACIHGPACELGQEIAHSLIETGSVDSVSVMKQEEQRLLSPIACSDPLIRRLGRGVAAICLLPG
jgi:hypothetical protein